MCYYVIVNKKQKRLRPLEAPLYADEFYRLRILLLKAVGKGRGIWI